MRSIAFIQGYMVLLLMAGCGTTRSYTATEQLLMSDAVDATVAKIDFSPLSGKKVYLDTTYVRTMKAPNALLDSDYVLSSIRQQMIAEEVHLVDSKDEAELIAEPRLGTMGLDGNSVTYGVPASSALSSASMFTGSPIPTIPEMSVGRREAKMGAAKIAVFAYVRQTREPYWQSGIARSSSTARDSWFFGIGPWQQGTIYEGTRFAGNRTRILGLPTNKPAPRTAAFEEFRSTKLFAAATGNPENADKSGELVADKSADPAAKTSPAQASSATPSAPTPSAPTSQPSPSGSPPAPATLPIVR